VPCCATPHKADVPFRHLLDLVLPPRCPGCGAIVEGAHRFCAVCWGGLRFPGPPACARCGVPFDVDRGAGACCATCLRTPPAHAGVAAAVAYGDVSRALALKLKYNGRAAFAITAARLMRRHLPADAEMLIPVPLHRWRLWSRGYNQAGLIADALSRLSGVPTAHRLLIRTRATAPLRGADPAARAKTVRGAFAVATPAAVARRRIVLIDDVYTTGATTDACVAALRRAGAASVAILVWARVLPSDSSAD